MKKIAGAKDTSMEVIINSGNKSRVSVCYGAISRFCAKHHHVIPIIVRLRVFWQRYYDKEVDRPGLAEILFALEHLNANHSSVVRNMCNNVWTSMMSASSLGQYVHIHVILPLSKNACDFPFEAQVLLASAIVDTFLRDFNSAQEHKHWGQPKPGPDLCAIPNCVCHADRVWTTHMCYETCEVLKELLENDCTTLCTKENAEETDEICEPSSTNLNEKHEGTQVSCVPSTPSQDEQQQQKNVRKKKRNRL